MGSNNVVIIASWPLVKEAFSQDSLNGREQEAVFNVFARDVVSAFLLNGKVWREQRRFALHQLRNLGFGKTRMEDHMYGEIEHLCEAIDKEMSSNKQTNFKRLMHLSAMQNISCLTFGRRMADDDPFKQRTELDLDATPSIIGLLAFFPALGRILASLRLFGFEQLRQRSIFMTNYFW